MNITQIRNATMHLNYGGTRFLIDPMLSAKGTWPGFPARSTTTLPIRWLICRCR